MNHRSIVVELTQSTQVPQAVVDRGDTCPMLRMAELSEQYWTRHLGHAVTETKNESTTDIHCY
jgi:hypothetical protein